MHKLRRSKAPPAGKYFIYYADWVLVRGYYLFLLCHWILFNGIDKAWKQLAKAFGRFLFWKDVMLVPLLKAWTPVAGLIFGGCCTNVFALEKIIKEQPASGLLVTFVQFVVVAVLTLGPHFSLHHPPFFLKPLAIPLTRWLPSTLMFFAVNILNNVAFGYNISVPVHIILRSGGSILTMLVGFVWGKRYTRVQVFSVCMLTVGIIIAAMADAEAKGKMSTESSSVTFDSEVLMGLAILFIAQLISAIMGLYIQLTYAKYGSQWKENLFYSHLLSLPLFIPFIPALRQQYNNLQVSGSINPRDYLLPSLNSSAKADLFTSPSNSSLNLLQTHLAPHLPSEIDISPHLIALAFNALTQYACIRGVNLLAAHTSALGVTIVLNVRKLASLFISIWAFGNRLPPGVATGAIVVFTSAGLWAWESQRISRRAAREKGGAEKRNGAAKESKAGEGKKAPEDEDAGVNGKLLTRNVSATKGGHTGSAVDGHGNSALNGPDESSAEEIKPVVGSNGSTAVKRKGQSKRV